MEYWNAGKMGKTTSVKTGGERQEHGFFPNIPLFHHSSAVVLYFDNRYSAVRSP
jgi:hypothetical protein